MIGFYTQKKDKTLLNMKEYFTFIAFMIMIIVIIMLTLFLIKYNKNKRKIRANELEDNYEYLPQKNKENLFGFE